MDYEHDDRRAADVPGASGAEGSGLPAGREPLDADLPSSRSPEVRAFDPHLGSGLGPSEPAASGPADDLFDAMFLTGGLRPPAFAAVDHDLGFPPPQAPDLASAFLAALDAIDDRRFVTPVPDETLAPSAPLAPPVAPSAFEAPIALETPTTNAAPVAPVVPVEPTTTGEPVYELRPQSRFELESERTAEPVEETPAEPVSAEGAAGLPWESAPESATATPAMPEVSTTESADDTWAFASYLESESDLQARAATAETHEEVVEAVNAPSAPSAPSAAEDVEEFATLASVASVDDEELIEDDAAPIEEAAYFAAGLDGDAGDDDDAEAAAVIAAEVEAEAEAVVAAAAQADADAEAAAAAAAAEAAAEAEALALAIAEAEAQAAAEQAELEAAIAAEAALDEASIEGSIGAPVGTSDDASDDVSDEAFYGAAEAVSDAASDTPSGTSADFASDFASETMAFGESAAESLDDDAFGAGFDLSALDAPSDARPDAAPAAAFGAGLIAGDDDLLDLPDDGDLSGDDDFELEPSIGMEPMDAAPMAFDGPDAFAAAPVAAAPEPEPESDELEDLQDFVVFSLGDMRCVVPIRNVVEVGRIPDAAPVPNAPVWLYGLGNLRGQVLSLIDLRALFGVGRIKASAGRMVVLRGDEDDITAGVMVDQVHQIVALSPARFKEAPASLPLPEKSAEYVRGACDYGNFTMINLDVDGVLGVESLTEEAV